MVTDKVEKAKLSEIGEVKVYIHEQINAFRAEMNSKFDTIQREMNSKFAEVDSKFDVLHKEMIKHFRWTIGIIAVLVGPTMGVNHASASLPTRESLRATEVNESTDGLHRSYRTPSQ